MASAGEAAEPLQYTVMPGPERESLLVPIVAKLGTTTLHWMASNLLTFSFFVPVVCEVQTTVLRVSIHCEGCKKKVKKVLHGIEGVYKVTVDAAQHRVTVTGSVGADALIRRLNKAGKQAALWPAPAPAAEAKKKPEEVTTAAAPPAAGEVCSKDVIADKADAKTTEAAKDKGADKQAEAEGSVKQQDKGSGKKPEKDEAGKPKDDGKKQDSEAKEKKGSPEPAKEAAAQKEEEGSAKKGGKKKKSKQQKDGGAEGEAAAEKKQPPVAAPAAPPPQMLGPEHPHSSGFPYHAPQPVMSYNVAHPSASVSYYAPAPAVPMQPMPPPPQVPYGYPPYPHMMLPEYLYGPPGVRSSPRQESYDNMFTEENADSCSLM